MSNISVLPCALSICVCSSLRSYHFLAHGGGAGGNEGDRVKVVD